MERKKLCLKRGKQPKASGSENTDSSPAKKRFANDVSVDSVAAEVGQDTKMDILNHSLLPVMVQKKLTTMEINSNSSSRGFKDVSEPLPEELENLNRNCCLCGKEVEVADSEHWKLCIQQFRNKSSDGNSAKEVNPDESICCFICQKSLSHMTALAMTQHMNRCLVKHEDDFLQQDESFSCPFCGKMLENKNRISHLKQCGKRNSFENLDILKILSLHKRQADERWALGLRTGLQDKPQKKIKKTNTKAAKKLIPASEHEADLQMAIALSSSLQEEKQRLHEMEEESLGIITEPSVFTAIMDARKEMKKKSQKKFEKSSPLLLLRSEIDRQQLVQERVAAVLNTDCQEMIENIHTCISDASSPKGPKSSSALIDEHIIQTSFLWSLSSLIGYEADDFDNYYVESLQCIVTPSKLKPGTKFRRLSQIPGRLATQARVLQNETKHEISNSQEAVSAVDDFLLDQPVVNATNRDSSIKTNEEDFLDISGIINAEELKKSSYFEDQHFSNCIQSSMLLPCSYSKSSAEKLIDDLSTLVGSEEMSDVQIQTKDSILPGHSFLFYIRCPKLFQEIETEKLQCVPKHCVKLDWSNITMATALEFLRFIYTGHVSGATVTRSEICYLIEKYELDVFVNKDSTDLKSKVADNKSFASLYPDSGKSHISGDESKGCHRNDVKNSSHMLLSEKREAQYFEQSHEVENIGLNKSNADEETQQAINMSLHECDTDMEGKNPEMSCTSNGVKSDMMNTSTNSLENNSESDGFKMWNSNQHVASQCFTSKRVPNNDLKDNLDASLMEIDEDEEVRTPLKSSCIRKDPFVSPFLSHVDYNPETSTSTPVIQLSRRNNSSVQRRFSISSIKMKNSESDQNFCSKIAEDFENGASETYNTPHETNSTAFPASSFSSLRNGNSSFRSSRKCNFSAEIINISSDHEVFDEHGDDIYPNSNHPAKIAELQKSQNAEINKESKLTDQNTSFPVFSNSDNAGALSPDLITSPVASESDEDAVIKNSVEHHHSFVNEHDEHSHMLEHENEIDDSFQKLQNESKADCIPLTTGEGFDDNGCGDETFLSLCKISDASDKAVESLSGEITALTQRHETNAEDSASKLIPQIVAGSSCTPVIRSSKPKKLVSKNIKKKNAKMQEVSPMPDFNAMNTPHLQQELKKIGVRQQKRKQAVKILQHVYEGTHPLVTEREKEITSIDTLVNHQQKQTDIIKQSQPTAVNADSNKQDEILSSSQSSTFSASSSNTDGSVLLEESFLFNSLEKETQCLQNDNPRLLATKLHQFFISDPLLHRNILTYEPLDFEKLHKDILEAGIKHSKKELMDYFDEQGITFAISKEHMNKGRCKSKKTNKRKKGI